MHSLSARAAKRATRWGLAAALLVIAGIAAAGCSQTETPTIDAVLLPPPQVPPREVRAPARVVVKLEAVEKDVEIAPGVTYTTWSFNGTVPGPMIRVRVGDQVEVRLSNAASNTNPHSIDLHAVNGPGGGAGATTVNPGEQKSFTFQAKTPGFYTYHCAAGTVADHITNGMYGGILVEGETRLPVVEREYYVGQSDLYTTGDTGEKGKQSLDYTKLVNEDPTYVVFNGNTKSLIAENALKANVGDHVRIYFTDGGPNLISSFHVIGEIFDKVYQYGSLDASAQINGVQTVLVPPGGASIVEFQVDVPGDYKLVDHALGRAGKGAVGILRVDGAPNPAIFNPLNAGPAAPATATAPAATATPAATAAPAGSTGAAPAAVTIKEDLKDNSFSAPQVTVAAGQKVTFTIANTGLLPHNMHIADAKGSYDGAGNVVSSPEIINPAKTGTLEWTAPTTPGTYKFRCDVHPDQMTGTITVQ
ncbi:MAG: nitrite reductase, copper-containing [Chloroflexi bacterium]|nr:nitrite reductase, copper-containing [Chloroflexota bacterium]